MNRYYAAIAGRANHRCEYCQAPELIFNFPFQVDTQSGKIIGITSSGKVTIEYLEMNSASQVAARQLWLRLGLFP